MGALMSRRLTAFLAIAFLLAINGGSYRANAELLDVIKTLGNTAGQILGESRKSLDELKTLKARLDLTADINARAHIDHSFGPLATSLSGLIEQLERSAGSSLGIPIKDLGANVQEVAVQLSMVAGKLDELLTRQRQCAVQDIGLLLASLNTLSLEFADRIPFSGSSKPHVSYFAFAGHAPTIVPLAGGVMSLIGYKLSDVQPPEVALLESGAGGAKIATLPAKAGATTNDALVEVEKSIIERFSGKCIIIEISTHGKGGIFGAPKSGSIFNLPMCIPEEFSSNFALSGQLSYRKPILRRRTLPAQEFSRTNDSCSDKAHISGELVWSLNKSGKIVDAGAQQLQVTNQTNVNYTIVNDRITFDGELDTASCIKTKIPPVFGVEVSKRLHHTEWSYRFAPIEEYPDVEEQSGISNSQKFERMKPGTNRLCVDVAKQGESDETLMWFQILSAGKTGVQRVFESPREVLKKDVSTRSYLDAQPYNVSAQFNPVPAGGNAQICVTITAPRCGY
jgi:hypothetical protein